MLNKITGWFLFFQLTYLAAFVALVLLVASCPVIDHALLAVREILHLPNSVVRLSDFVSYPFLFSAPLNISLAVAFLWRQLRRKVVISISNDFFSILNTIYIASSGWILFMGFFDQCHPR